MKQLKNKTIALVLASVVTVVGAFGADNYKNSLMSLKFDNSANGGVNLTVYTKVNYENSITPVRKDANTYVIMLPEVNSQMAEQPEFGANIQSVDIKTLPYTTNGKGYTKITIKTYPNTLLTTQTAVFLPTSVKKANSSHNSYSTPSQPQQIPSYTENEMRYAEQQFQPTPQQEEVIEQEEVQSSNNENNSIASAPTTVTPADNKTTTPPPQEEDSTEKLMLILASIFIIITSVFFYVRGKNKIAEVLGESTTYDINYENEGEKTAKKEDEKKKRSNYHIKKAIQKLDKKYTQPIGMQINMPTIQPKKPEPMGPLRPAEDVIFTPEPEINNQENKVIDLDIMNQTPESIEEEVDSLTEFLNDYNFEEQERQKEKELLEQKEKETNELYNKFINNEDLLFSKDDIQKINTLLMSEITDDTINNIEHYAATNPVRPPHATQEEILENFITTFTVKQNISFSKDDVDALKKLINVEIDNDFLTDLRTNPDRVKAMQKELEEKSMKPHKVSELLTLNVKDILPNISDELKKQGNIGTESKSKPVYYNKEIDVNILAAKDSLPDLTKAIKDKSNIKYTPSEKFQLSETGYDVQKIYTGDILPDLQDVIAHPDKYKEPEPEPVVVDEDALLKSISNVTFKPFYDGTQEFEVLNNFDDDDIQEEVYNFDSLNINQDNTEQNDSNIVLADETDVFNELIEEQNFNSETNNYTELTEETVKEEVPSKLQEKVQAKIKEEISEPEPVILSYENNEYTVIASNSIKDNMDFCLAKNDEKYIVFGNIDNNLIKLKEYSEIKNEKFQVRVYNTLEDGTIQYIIKTGLNKFVLNVNENKMEFVMDLC
ncbi:hypothetical protein IJ750_01345 [bacterium]|nr:hypothetical protein [bacterium]